ncbi:DUF6515 family protein [Paraflavisolibacter sp. H34]|uniref:DUF6515 family protein n=1 Tax=Huijunlia imazamoxiresistens TaxID=3127457 RepID=UPI003016F4C8
MRLYAACMTGLLVLAGLAAGAQRSRNYHDAYRSYPSRHHRVVYRSYPQPVYRSYPRPVVVVPRAVVPYRYYPGPVYPRIGASVSIFTPNIGVHISTLPFGYRPVWLGPSLFFYYQGTFYRRTSRDYEVVNAPIGAEVPDLPERARVVVIDNNKYYELDGTFFRETIRPNGDTWYTVTGKDGGQVVQLPPQSSAPAAVGDVLTALPQGCKVIVLNNQKYYVAPDDTYYQEVIENNQIFYKVAGTPAAQ